MSRETPPQVDPELHSRLVSNWSLRDKGGIILGSPLEQGHVLLRDVRVLPYTLHPLGSYVLVHPNDALQCIVLDWSQVVTLDDVFTMY